MRAICSNQKRSTLRFLANENVPGDAVTALTEAGYDIVWIRTAAPGSADEDVLAWAMREGRILLTFDQDFGELLGAPACRLPVASFFSAYRCRLQ
jgi:predicted nuclease of predicted toxin-antitoxin system